MGLIILVLINALYYMEINFLAKSLGRSKFFDEKRAWYLICYLVLSCVILVVNLAVCVLAINLMGGDTEFAGFGFVIMGSIVISLSVLLFQFIKQVIKVFGKYPG